MDLEQEYDEKSCGVILYFDDLNIRKFLLLHYPEGHWDFPKGHVEDFDIDERGTAKREVAEETGIEEIEFIENFTENIFYTYQRRDTGKSSRKKVVFFLAKCLKSESITLSHEHQNFEWLNFEQALETVTFADTKDMLRKAQKFLEN